MAGDPSIRYLASAYTEFALVREVTWQDGAFGAGLEAESGYRLLVERASAVRDLRHRLADGDLHPATRLVGRYVGDVLADLPFARRNVEMRRSMTLGFADPLQAGAALDAAVASLRAFAIESLEVMDMPRWRSSMLRQEADLRFRHGQTQAAVDCLARAEEVLGADGAQPGLGQVELLRGDWRVAPHGAVMAFGLPLVPSVGANLAQVRGWPDDRAPDAAALALAPRRTSVPTATSRTRHGVTPWSPCGAHLSRIHR